MAERSSDVDMISRVRHFNRTVTLRIGALENRFLGRGRSLGASRVLFEIGAAGIQVRELRERLGLDSGYTSRLLRALEKEGLVRVSQSKEDARVRRVRMTASGVRELSMLNRLSDHEAASILEPLSDRQRAALTDAMETVDRLLRAGAVVIEVEDPSSPAARECLARYYRELAERFDSGFDPDESIPATPWELTPPNGCFLLARLQGEAVGCAALKCHPDFGEVKRMWVSAPSRGLGIGRRLLSHIEAIARSRKLPLLRLETNKSLTEAQALYRSAGYREVAPFNSEPYAHHWFEKSLAE